MKKKMDPKLVARFDKNEINYIAKRYKIPVKDVRKAAKNAGRSRVKVYTALMAMGYCPPYGTGKSKINTSIHSL